MKVVNLVGGDRRPSKQRQSYMCESAVLRRSGSPVFALHQPIICGLRAECDAIAVGIGIPLNVLARATRPLKWYMCEGSRFGPAG